jgi:hypothetical protein
MTRVLARVFRGPVSQSLVIPGHLQKFSSNTAYSELKNPSFHYTATPPGVLVHSATGTLRSASGPYEARILSLLPELLSYLIQLTPWSELSAVIIDSLPCLSPLFL